MEDAGIGRPKAQAARRTVQSAGNRLEGIRL